MKLREELDKEYETIVVKLSSLAVTHDDGGVDLEKIEKIAKDINEIKLELRVNIVLVSSGAINAAKKSLFIGDEPSIDQLQACSAYGQPLLMKGFEEVFSRYGLKIGQVLLTHDDLKSKRRSQNIKACLNQLIENDIIPVINENDSVSFEEISLGDNDQLSAMITELLNSKLLVMLTKTDGVYTDDPNNSDVEKIDFFDHDDPFERVTTKTKTPTGRGGMATKLVAVRKLTPLGVDVIISGFEKDNPVVSAITDQDGSFFRGAQVKRNKKDWLLTRMRVGAEICIDHGAWLALSSGASLLPSGVSHIKGVFRKGDCVGIYYQGLRVGAGLAEYSSSEIDKIKGLSSRVIKLKLSSYKSNVIVHRNNMMLDSNGANNETSHEV